MAHISKENMVAKLKDCLQNSSGLMVTNFDKLNVVDVDKLRKKLGKDSTRLLVAKNTLLKIALAQVNLDKASQFVEGKTGIAVFEDDPVAPTKTLFEFSKSREDFKIRGGIVEGLLVNELKAKELSELPSREVLIAMVVNRMQSPLSGFVNVLSGTIRGLVNVIDQIAKQKEK